MRIKPSMASFYATVLDSSVEPEKGSHRVGTKGRDRCCGVMNPVSRPKQKRSTLAESMPTKRHRKASKGKRYVSKGEAQVALSMALQSL